MEFRADVGAFTELARCPSLSVLKDFAIKNPTFNLSYLSTQRVCMLLKSAIVADVGHIVQIKCSWVRNGSRHVSVLFYGTRAHSSALTLQQRQSYDLI